MVKHNSEEKNESLNFKIPCGTKCLRVPIFENFGGKHFLRKNLLHCRNYIQTLPVGAHLLKTSLSFKKKTKQKTKNSEIKR